jgi:ubiquinone/menaquinone biosynthesis C-methylase UbiE
MKIVDRYRADGPLDLDVGAGKSPKASISLDIYPFLRPLIVGDLRHLPIRSDALSSIVCSHVLEHVEDSDLVLREFIRVLKNDGLVFLFLPDDESTIWRILEPVWTRYYEAFISKESSPRTHAVSFDLNRFTSLVSQFFRVVEMGKINFGMEMYAVCKKGEPSTSLETLDSLSLEGKMESPGPRRS